MSNVTPVPASVVAHVPRRVVPAIALVGLAVVPIVAFVATFTLLVVAALVDVRERRLPDRIVGAAALPILGTWLLALAADRADLARSILIAAALLAGPLLALHVVDPAGLGFGDVKAGAVLGAALGLVDPLLAIWSLGAASAVGLVWLVVTGRRSLPFGAPLVLAGIVAVVVGVVRGAEVMTWG